MTARSAPDPTVRIGPGEAMAVFAVVAIGFFFFAPELQVRGYLGILASQLLLILLPVVAYAWTKGRNVLETLAVRLPRPRDLLGAVVIGASAWVVNLGVGIVQEQIAPMPEELAKELEQLFVPLAAHPLLALASLAIAPAIVEEILCRAMLTRSFRGVLGPAGAVVVSALLFAMLHQSAYRFVPQFLLGLSLGTVTLATRSVIPAMIIHALHNAGLIFASPLLPEHVALLGVTFAGATVALVLGHVVVLRRPSAHAE